jgi:hypothetical protein
MDQRRLELELRRLQVEIDLLPERAKQQMRLELLPHEQVPALAEALAGLFRGMNLSVYGQEPTVLGAVAPLVEVLVQRLRAQLEESKDGE